MRRALNKATPSEMREPPRPSLQPDPPVTLQSLAARVADQAGLIADLKARVALLEKRPLPVSWENRLGAMPPPGYEGP